MIFVKDRVSDLIGTVYAVSDNYFYTLLVFGVSTAILVWIGRKLVKDGRYWVIATFDRVIDKIPFLNTIYRVLKKVSNMISGHASVFGRFAGVYQRYFYHLRRQRSGRLQYQPDIDRTGDGL